MPQTLADSLQLVLPFLSPELVTADSAIRIQKLARVLPPIPLGGFETRLGLDRQVDFLQCIQREDGAPTVFAQYIRSTPLQQEPVWARLSDFATRWAEPGSPLHHAINDLWLEFDLDDAITADLPIPSIFLSLNVKDASASDRLNAIRIALPLVLGRDISPLLLDNLMSCFRACPQGTAVSHIAMMLSRSVEAMRINIVQLRSEQMVPYLKQVRWDAPLQELEPLLARLFELVDHVTLCLDVGTKVYPRLGLECNTDSGLENPQLLAPLLDELVERGLCMRAKRDALLGWHGTLSPNDTPLAWPEHLVVRSLVEAPNFFSVMGRRLSHVKIVYQPGRSLEAKGYIGFGHLWVNSDAPEGAPSLKSVRQVTGKTKQIESVASVKRQELDSAIAAATDFLLSSRNSQGWWEDFWGPVGAGDEWVTAYMATVLAAAGEPRTDEAIYQAWSLLLSRRTWSDGWGYNSQSPSDSDSTAWGLRLAECVGGANSQRAESARRFIAQHLEPDGSVTTYQRETFGKEGRDGWSQPHVCVTANVAQVHGFEDRTREFLRRAQLDDGSWKSFWTPDSEYATALAAEALAFGTPEQRACVPRAVEWICHRLGGKGYAASPARPGGSPFATAWGLRTMLLAQEGASIRAILIPSARWLLAQQRSDGSWLPSVRLRVPPHQVLDPANDSRTVLMVFDQNRNFTTATVLSALLGLRERWEDLA